MTSDEALLGRLHDGDLRAFDELYARHSRRLFAFLSSQAQDAHEAEDLLHEAFLALLKEKEQARRARHVTGFLYQVARNLCLNRARARRRASHALEQQALAVDALAAELPGATDAAPVHEQLEQLEQTARLHQAVAELTEAQGQLFALRAGGPVVR